MATSTPLLGVGQLQVEPIENEEPVLVSGIFDGLPPIPPAPEAVPPTIEEKIVARALELGVDPLLPLEIAKAESGLNPDAQNKLSTASGLFQFIDSTFSDFCMEKYRTTDNFLEKDFEDVQIECAVKMLADGGLSHWDESKSVWYNKVFP